MSKLKDLKLKQLSVAVKEGRPVAVEKIGQRLCDIRKALGMTQKQLAKRIKISQPLLSRIEDKIESCTLKTVLRVARALECDFLGVLISRDSLEAIIRKQAGKKANSMVKRTFASMAMEQQAPEAKASVYQVNKLTEELAAHPDSALWEE